MRAIPIAIAAVLLFIVLLFIVIGFYNRLVGLKNRAENTFSGIDVILKKRYDLIPDLVATVKQYAQHEQETLTNIAALRSRVVSGRVSAGERVQLENRLSEELSKLLVTFETYPELKANEGFLRLQASLTEVEEQISASRRFYNTAVTDYNNAVEMFPTNLMANMMNYRRKSLFEAPATERQKTNVSDLFKR